MVRCPERDLNCASAITSLISFMPARTALKGTNSDLVRRAIRRASVVLPQPGGPQKSMEPRLSDSICRRGGLPGRRSFSWRMNSSSVRGRMRSASGWWAEGESSAGSVAKRDMDKDSLGRNECVPPRARPKKNINAEDTEVGARKGEAMRKGHLRKRGAQQTS